MSDVLDEDVPDVPDVAGGDEGQPEPEDDAAGGDGVPEAVGKAGAAAAVAPPSVTARILQEGSKMSAEIVDAVLPFSDRLYRNLATWSLERMAFSAGTDTVGVEIHDDGSLDFVPVKHSHAEVNADEGEVTQSGWQVKDCDRAYAETSNGTETQRLGKAQAVLLDGGGTRRVAPTEARVRNALVDGRWQHVFRVEEPGAVEMPLVVDGEGVGDGSQAVADGGATVAAPHVKEAVLEDTLVDITPEDGYDGEVLSLSKVRDTYREVGDVERLDEQERLGYEAGRLAGRDDDTISKVIKILLAVAAILAVVIIGPDLLGQGGGAAGSAISDITLPFVTALLGVA